MNATLIKTCKIAAILGAVSILMLGAGGFGALVANIYTPDPLADYRCTAWYYDERGPVEGRYCIMYLHKDHDLHEGRLSGGRLKR